MHQVGHWLRLYYDARSAKHQNQRYSLFKVGLNSILIYVCQDSREPSLNIRHW